MSDHDSIENEKGALEFDENVALLSLWIEQFESPRSYARYEFHDRDQVEWLRDKLNEFLQK